MSLTYSNTAMTLGIQRHLALHTQNVARSMERLSSGLRINRAADDPAGLAIAERLGARVRSINQAVRNANDGISAMQIAEGALNEVSGLLIRVRELAVQSASGTLADGERAILDQEAQGLIEEIDRIASVTETHWFPKVPCSVTDIARSGRPFPSRSATETEVESRSSPKWIGASKEPSPLPRSREISPGGFGK